MVTVNLPRSLVALFADPPPRHVQLDAGTVEEVVRELDRVCPGMWDRVCEPGPRLREHINVFVNGESGSLGTAVPDGGQVHIIPAVAGGS